MTVWTFLAGALFGATLSAALTMHVRKELDSNRLAGFVFEVAQHVWTLSLAGAVIALILWLVR